MVTPIDDDKKINEDSLRQYVEFCIEGEVDGLFPNSSVGEFPHFSIEEKKRIIAIVYHQANGRVPVFPGIIETHPEASIELGHYARKLGCEGVVICPPYYYRPSQEMVEKHFEIVADALDNLPILLYNIPMFTVPITRSIIYKLSKRKNIVGIKDSSGNMTEFIHYLEEIPPANSNFSILTGREEIFLPSLAAGADGCVTGMSGILPEIMVGIYRAFKDGKLELALSLQYSFLPLLRLISSMPFPLGFKISLELRGIPTGNIMQPLSKPQAEELAHKRLLIDGLMDELLTKWDCKTW